MSGRTATWALRGVTWACGVLSLTACTGQLFGGSDASGAAAGGAAGPVGTTPGVSGVLSAEPSLNNPAALGPTPLRRLSREEYRASIRDALGIEPGVEIDSAFPPDPETPFDNDAALQAQSIHALVPGLDAIAAGVAERAMADGAVRSRLFGCQPSGPEDNACMQSYVRSLGRRLLRRPLTADETNTLVAAAERAATGAKDFASGARVVLAALLQDFEFVYRVEQGTPVAGQSSVVRLTDGEMASRLSYLLWGSLPDEGLMGQVEKGGLATPAGLLATAQAMLGDSRAKHQTARFHAMWLGYEHEQRLPPALASAMRQESDALVQRIVYDENRSWFDLFTADQTFVSDELAKHYGLPGTASTMPQWVSYGSSGRRGILSQASFLAGSSPKPGDTSPTQRGLHIRRRLLCQEVPRPDAAILRSNACKANTECAAGSKCVVDAQSGMGVCVVDVDQPPPGNACKTERYSVHAHGACASCHTLVDGIGFGLERYALDGSYREHDDGRPECPIEARGTVSGVGDFSGPGELGTLLAASEPVQACAVTQVFRYAMGRQDASTDQAMLGELGKVLQNHGDALQGLLLELVASEAFRHRVLPE